MPIPTRASAWVLAASSFVLGGGAFAQATPPSQTIRPPVAGQENAPRGSGGRNQFIAPVMNMEIKGEGVALPAGLAQPEETIKPPASAPAPAEKPTAK